MGPGGKETQEIALDSTRETGGGRLIIMQQISDQTLYQHVENGQGTKEVADVVKARPINRTRRAPEDLWKGEGDRTKIT